MTSEKKFAAPELYALAFGLFLGLCIVKFGNPVILDQKISDPQTLSEYWSYSWPAHWAGWWLLPLAAIGAFLALPLLGSKPSAASRQQRYRRGLLLLPLLWLGWQMVSATKTVDAGLTATTLWQFSGCVACYFLGAFIFRQPRALTLLLAGILAGFALCLVRAIEQKIEFPQSAKFLLHGQETGWTNFPPDMVEEMRRDQTIITTNGVERINPVMLAKFTKGRVMGTLVYPNALAGLILMLFPVSLVLALKGAAKMRPIIGALLIGTTTLLSLLAFFWSGSKFGWLIAMLMGAVCLFRLNWPVKLKLAALLVVAVLGLGVFTLRFHNYFAHGATSAVARLDYWRAAVQTTLANPVFGTGPGTFQRPYAALKSPEAEMARLTHNDYLEQFSDSGLVGGMLYVVWIVGSLVFIGRNIRFSQNRVILAVFLGLLAWFVQGLGEFGLYIPALAWIAFTLLGSLLYWAEAEKAGLRPGGESIRQKTRRD